MTCPGCKHVEGGHWHVEPIKLRYHDRSEPLGPEWGKSGGLLQEGVRSRQAVAHMSPDGAIVAEMSIGGARFLVADESPEHQNFSPESLGGTSVRVDLFVADPDTVQKQAVAAGAKGIFAVADQDFGYRMGRVVDPSGHHWLIGRPHAGRADARV